MKAVKKIIIGVSLCLLLGLTLPMSEGCKVSAAENTTQIGFEAQSAGSSVDPDRVTTVSKDTQNRPVRTGDGTSAGRYALLLIGSAAVMLWLLMAKVRKEEEENKF